MADILSEAEWEKRCNAQRLSQLRIHLSQLIKEQDSSVNAQLSGKEIPNWLLDEIKRRQHGWLGAFKPGKIEAVPSSRVAEDWLSSNFPGYAGEMLPGYGENQNSFAQADASIGEAARQLQKQHEAEDRASQYARGYSGRPIVAPAMEAPMPSFAEALEMRLNADVAARLAKTAKRAAAKCSEAGVYHLGDPSQPGYKGQ